jgi:hypothetical protein
MGQILQVEANLQAGGHVINSDLPVKANVDASKGRVVVVVAGFVVLPAAANKDTGKIPGVVFNAAKPISGGGSDGDNTGGADGAVVVDTKSGHEIYMKNDAGAPFDATMKGDTVYGKDFETGSTDLNQGPPIGKLMGFNEVRAFPGKPLRVRITRV